ncbi:hypothetical protein [Sporomusa sphaeroides]|uniref:hypothetical protein n=1 Tax=Sporomusa sphaeroides TaxID=47679 RepID=UPI00202FB807|nr:hypothetical protein [Sporomusa sphaeroides]MCM0759928.1 hypothetical protein [Sporomusa sphaeroides DSM 2875]HML33872.1 hypothetical protein [Sporomusa sphaeroides]
MTITSEFQIFIWAAGAILAANLLAMALFVLFAKLPDGRFRQAIHSIILELDKFADRMENEQKRRTAIQQINDILGWRRILVPAALIGWIIDAEVAAIRKMQAATDTPDLHKEENKNG